MQSLQGMGAHSLLSRLKAHVAQGTMPLLTILHKSCYHLFYGSIQFKTLRWMAN